jgi:hypothetical protein
LPRSGDSASLSQEDQLRSTRLMMVRQILAERGPMTAEAIVREMLKLGHDVSVHETLRGKVVSRAAAERRREPHRGVASPAATQAAMCIVAAFSVSGKQLGAFRRDLCVGAALGQPEPAAGRSPGPSRALFFGRR